MYSAHASVLPAPRPARRSHPGHSPGGGTWWGSGRQRVEARPRSMILAAWAAMRWTSVIMVCSSWSDRPGKIPRPYPILAVSYA